MFSWLTVFVFVVAVAYALTAAFYLVRDRIVDDTLLVLLAALEVLLLAQVVVGIVLGAETDRAFEAPVFYAYLGTVPFVPPLATFLALKEKSRWSMGVVVGSALVVGIFLVRLNQIWTANA